MPVTMRDIRPFTSFKIAVRRHFNMVEMALALGVVAVGLISILALFPIGLSASRDAMAISYSSDVAEQMIHQMEYFIRQPGGWDTYVFDLDTPSNNTPLIPNLLSRPDLDSNIPDFAGTAIAGTNDSIYEAANFTPPLSPSPPLPCGVYKVIRYADRNSNGAYNPAIDFLDFETIIRIWLSPVDIPTESGSTGALNYKVAAVLNVELSWPAQLPYARRQKSYYVKELFKR